MSQVIQGSLNATDLRFGIVVSRFNDFITERLLDGAIEGVTTNGGDENNITVVWVPGAFEIPLAAQTLAASGNYDVVVALGAVIRGETPHFDYVCQGVTHGVTQVSLNTGVPVAFGVLTTDNIEQARARISPLSNKGKEAVVAIIETVNALRMVNANG